MFFDSDIKGDVKAINWKLHDQKLAKEMKEWAAKENQAFFNHGRHGGNNLKYNSKPNAEQA